MNFRSLTSAYISIYVCVLRYVCNHDKQNFPDTRKQQLRVSHQKIPTTTPKTCFQQNKSYSNWENSPIRKIVWVKNPQHWQRILNRNVLLHRGKTKTKHSTKFIQESERERKLCFGFSCLFVYYFRTTSLIKRPAQYTCLNGTLKMYIHTYLWIRRRGMKVVLGTACLFFYFWQCCFCFSSILLFSLLPFSTTSYVQVGWLICWLHSTFFLCEIFSMNFAFCWTSCVECESSER